MEYTDERRAKTYDFPSKKDPQINKWLTSRMLRGSTFTRFKPLSKRRFVKKLKMKAKRRLKFYRGPAQAKFYRRLARKLQFNFKRKNQLRVAPKISVSPIQVSSAVSAQGLSKSGRKIKQTRKLMLRRQYKFKLRRSMR